MLPRLLRACCKLENEKATLAPAYFCGVVQKTKNRVVVSNLLPMAPKNYNHSELLLLLQLLPRLDTDDNDEDEDWPLVASAEVFVVEEEEVDKMQGNPYSCLYFSNCFDNQPANSNFEGNKAIPAVLFKTNHSEAATMDRWEMGI